MPNLNMMEEERSGGRPPVQPMMARREGPPMAKILMIVGALVALGAVVFLLNSFGVVHLWGKKAVPQQTEVIPLPAETVPEVTPTPQPVEIPAPTTTKPAEKKLMAEKTAMPASKGEYTLVIASFRERKTAEEFSSRWSGAGFPSMVMDKTMKDGTWYRVSVGRYANRKEATDAGKKMEHMFESGYWVDRMR